VDDLEEQAYLGPSLGIESHKLDDMNHTLGEGKIWEFPLEEREETLK